MTRRSTLRAWTLGASLAVGAVMTATEVRATPLDFSFVNGAVTASWEQDSNPTPIAYANWNTYIMVTDGISSSGPIADVLFYSSILGGFSTAPTDNYEPGNLGTQIYSGSEANPVFAAGTYTLNAGVLTVTDAGTPAPEPAGVAIFGTVLGCFLMLGRRKRAPLAPQ